PHLYDLGEGHTGRMFLEAVRGDMVVLAWMFPRAAFWLLDRDGIKGHYGENQIAVKDEDEDEEKPEAKGIGAVDVPDRHIYCLDLREHADHRVCTDEVKRIAAECKARRETKKPLLQLSLAAKVDNGLNGFTAEKMLAQPGRRWYPVIDY